VTGVDLDAVEEIIVSRVKQLNDRRQVVVTVAGYRWLAQLSASTFNRLNKKCEFLNGIFDSFLTRCWSAYSFHAAAIFRVCCCAL